MPCSKPSPCLIVLAHNEAKIVCRFAASPCLKKNSANFIFFGKNVKPCLTSRLPLGGKLSTSLTDEGRSLLRTAFLYTVFSIAKRQKLSALFQAFPLPEKNSANFIFFGKNGKPCLTSRLPHGGRLLAKQGGEGRSLLRTGCFKQFNKKIPPFFIGSKKAPCFSQDAFHIKSLIPLYFPQSRRRFPSFLPRFPQAFLPSRTRRCSYRR